MDVDDLYGLPLERFVPERTALARELRASGQRDEAADVAALRKPSVAAWAVNQLVRTQRRALDDLFGAGDALRETQAELLTEREEGRQGREARRSRAARRGQAGRARAQGGRQGSRRRGVRRAACRCLRRPCPPRRREAP